MKLKKCISYTEVTFNITILRIFTISQSLQVVGCEFHVGTLCGNFRHNKFWPYFNFGDTPVDSRGEGTMEFLWGDILFWKFFNKPM